jgi:photosystem II stability/assembly factor-like uncharacterized protein
MSSQQSADNPVASGESGIGAALTGSMRWRCIGPHRGGRVVAAAGDPSDAMVFYFGAAGGGVWKTTDGGTYWENVTDGFFNTAAVGAIAVSDSDPNVIYAGTGESCIRGNVTHGDGVYRSTDAGKTWSHVGLTDSRHIARVRVHPADPDLVYVAALGHAFGPNEERGVFRSKDGGANWEKILYKSENAGAIDLSIDPNNPRIMFAAIWQARREPHTFTSGGPDSGLHGSTDGGDTWTDISGNKGLPDGVKGRIGVAVSPAMPGRVWAIIEAEARGLYRSDDGGDSWERVSDDGNLMQRPWYYCHVYADPQDPETVYVLGLNMWKSTDGGRTFTRITTPHGDNHELWIDPRDPRRMIEGNDGGACVSFNGGDTWSTIYNQPTSQFYHLTTDDQFPYRVYATQQDNSAISVPSRSTKGAITWSDCYAVGSSESGHIAVRPDDPNIIYSGAIGSSPGGGDSLLRYDHSIGQTRIVSVWPEFQWGLGLKDHKYRFQWTYPIVISPHDPKVLYVAGQVVFRSDDDGESWEIVSPDLTRGDRTKMEPAGGPVTLDTTMVEHYGTIFALTESVHEKGLFWAGSDDGLVHISRDGSKTWEDVTPPDLPEWTRVDVIEVSPHDPATAYLSATRYKFDDNRPFLFKTKDYGKSWTRITDGIPEDDFTRVIREDPVRRGLLYAGTETGVYVSLDDGGSWQRLQLNLPTVPISDLLVKDNDLVVATNGRSFWILDDLAVLRQAVADRAEDAPRLFQPAPTYRFTPPLGAGRPAGPGRNYALGLGYAAGYRDEERPDGETVRVMLDAGANPPDGVVVHYFLETNTDDEATITFHDSKGEEIKSFSSVKPAKEEGTGESATGEKKKEDPLVRVEAGMNRFTWDMRYPDARQVDIDDATDHGLAGPHAPPGTYAVHLTVAGRTQTQDFEIRKDPRIPSTQADLQAQFDLLIAMRDKISQTHDAINTIIRVKKQVDEWVGRAVSEAAKDAVSKAGEELNGKLSAVEDQLIQYNTIGGLDRISHPAKLNAKIREISTVPSTADYAPTQGTLGVFGDLSERLDLQFEALKSVIENDLPIFIDVVHELEIPAISSGASG